MALFNWLEDAEERAKQRQLAKTKRIEDYANRETPLLDATWGTNRWTPGKDIANNRLDWRAAQGIGQSDALVGSGEIDDDYCKRLGMVFNPATGRCGFPDEVFKDQPDIANPYGKNYQECLDMGFDDSTCRSIWSKWDRPDKDPRLQDPDLVPETPPELYPTEEVIKSLASWLTADASQATEDAYWDAKMRRLNEQYEEAREQLSEDLNVKGLYYSGVRGDQLREMADDFQRTVAEEEAKFQYERFDRDVKRYGMAMQYSLGARAQEIDWAYKRGQLTLQQLDLALQETLGISALELQDKGMLLDYMMGMYYVGIAQEQNDMSRQQMWLNTVSLLYQLGVSEEEINGLYMQIAGQPSSPPV